MNVRSIVLAAALGLAACPSSAEPNLDGLPLRATLPEEAGEPASSARDPGSTATAPNVPPSRECGRQAALYGSGSQKVWVTRSGSAQWRNPLRPMAPEILQVVQVAVNGRAGSAYGPDFSNLQQGDPAALGADPVVWTAAIGEVPPELRVIADDGRVLVGPLAFVTCGDAPKVARTVTKPDRRRASPAAAADPGPGERTLARPPDERARAARPDAAPRSPGLPMPQGAIP